MNVFDFSLICKRVQFSICPALGQEDPVCFSRNIGIGNWLMFQPGREKAKEESCFVYAIFP